MPFPGPDDHNISLEDAATLTRRYRNAIASSNIIGGLFNADAVRDLLNQPDCAGLRYYHGLDSGGKPVLVLVGVTAENVDLFEGTLLEMSVLCPDFCSETNPLNSNS
ncbi:MAG TPA: hypothetical protein VFW78_12595 [Bacteroidia bacterium]|nr:hypothetical protein [Bacteroidia bacterium]